MAFIKFSKAGSTPFEQLLGHSPEILEKWTQLEMTFFESSHLNSDLKEEIRRVLAFLNGCEYCKAKGHPTERFTAKKDLLAIELAKMIATKCPLSEEFVSDLKEYYSDEQLSWLCAFVSFISASQRFGATLNLTPTCTIN